MAGFLCIFLDSCNSIPSNPYHFPSKPFRILTPIHNPLISTKIMRRRRRTTSRDSLQISALSQKFHLIQTTVHHDGSLIFQFGDPSEILKIDESVEDLVSEGEEGTHGLEVVEEDHDREVIVDTIESEKRDENDVSSSNDVSQSVNGVDNGAAVIDRAGDVEKHLGDSLVESSESDFVVEDLERGGEEVSKVLDGDHEKQVIRTTVIEERSDNDSFTDESETQVEISEPDDLMEDLESEGVEISNIVNVDADNEKQELEKTTGSDTSSSSYESDSNEVNNEIAVVEREKDLTDSQEETKERLVKTFQAGEVPLPLSVYVSVSEIESNDFVRSSGLSLDNTDDKEKCLNTDEDVSSRPVELEVAADSFSVGRIEESEKVKAGVTKFESPSSKIKPTIEDPNAGVMQLSSQKIEAGLQIEVADSSNEADADISVVEIVGNVVGDLSNDVIVDEDHETQELDKLEELKETTGSDISSSSDVFDCSNEVDNESTVVEREKYLIGSQEESNERLVKHSQDGELSLLVSEIEITDFISSGLVLENAYDKEKCSDEDANVGAVQLCDQKTESQIEVADSSNEADGDISVVEKASDVVGDPSDSQPELTEIPLVLSVKLGGLLSDSDIRTNDHFDSVGSSDDAIADENESSMSVTDSTLENIADIKESSFFELDALDNSAPINEVVNISVDVSDQNILSELELAKTIDSGEIDLVEVRLAQGLEAEPVIEDGVAHDSSVEVIEADDIESPFLPNQDFSNSLVGAERNEVEEQINELSGVPIVEAMQLEIAKTNAKREENSTTSFIFISGAAALTHPSKALTGGEDAYFITCSNWLGIADGISQWSLEGIDRGVYAHELMKNCEIIVSDNGNAQMLNPTDVISRSVEETLSSGSSTVLVAYFDGQALHVANIGDTGFIIIRHGAVYKKSSPMFHEFNFPVHIQSDENPSQFSKEYIIDLDEEDTIITATDGLFDNLYDLEIASIVSKSLQAAMKPEEIAQVLATRAQEGGKSGRGRSPFADAAKAAGYIGFTGGKLDDVTVIVSLVKKRAESYI